MQEGMELIYTRFGIEMHMGCEKTESKTKHVFSPPPEILSEYAKKRWHKMMILSLEGV